MAQRRSILKALFGGAVAADGLECLRYSMSVPGHKQWLTTAQL